MEIVLVIHSHLRWLVVLVAVIAAVKFAIGWLRGGVFKGMDRGLAAAFAGTIDLQALLGIINLLWLGFSANGGGFPRHRLEHAFIMILAAVLSHLPARWKTAADNIRFRNTFLCILGALLLIYIGVATLPGGWTR
jgi:multisubunit Na+/H+ antiporter MnhB subunit